MANFTDVATPRLVFKADHVDVAIEDGSAETGLSRERQESLF